MEPRESEQERFEREQMAQMRRAFDLGRAAGLEAAADAPGVRRKTRSAFLSYAAEIKTKVAAS